MGFEFNKCCFCIELRTGCLIIGYLNLISCIAESAMTIIYLAGACVYLAQRKEERVLVTYYAVVTAIKLVFLILLLAFTIVLLVGLHKYKRGHVKAYLIYKMIFIVLIYIVLFIIMVCVGMSTEHTHIIMFVANLIYKLLHIYFLLVLRSYYLKMDDKPAIYTA